MKRALVTGSEGFLGRHVCRALEHADYHVIDLDCTWGGDVRDFFKLGGMPHYDVAFHCAAVGADRGSIDKTPLALAANLELDAAFFQWAERNRPGRVVYFSSSAAYPVILQHGGSGHRLTERNISLKHPQAPDGIYGWIKLTGERVAALAQEAGVSVSVVRPFSGYGEDQDTRFPFPALAARAWRRENPFGVWGSGEQVRDFIHVADIMAALMVIISEDIDGPVNLGTGRGFSSLALARMLCEEAGYSPQFKPTGQHEGVSYRVADPNLMLEFYTPKVSLEEGVERMMRK